MKISFVRTKGERDRIHVQRDDGSEASWQFPNFGNGLPHDGLWARVAKGADPGRIMQEANRRGGKDKFAALGDQTGIYQSEAIANHQWLAPGSEPAALLAAAHAAAADYGVELPARVTVAAIAGVRARLLELQAQWLTFVPKGAVTLEYP